MKTWLKNWLQTNCGNKGPGRGRPRKRPQKLHADKAYDDQEMQEGVEKAWDKDPDSNKGHRTEHQKLGRHRWVVERTLLLAWLANYRRLTIR